ncbi:MAG: hypothetical protein ACM3P0_14540 [Acidobacteriota bacterium]
MKNFRFATAFLAILLLALLHLSCGTSGTGTESGVSTSPEIPIMVKSKEATLEQLWHARAEGDAVERCVAWILDKAGQAKGEVLAGEYKISVALTAPEGFYELKNNTAVWNNPSKANAHLWVFVQDGADNRIVPPLEINAQLLDEKGNIILNTPMPFVWTPMLNGYGRNVTLSSGKNITIKLNIAPPRFRRHDQINGERFTKPVVAFVTIPVNLSRISNSQALSSLMENDESLAGASGQAYLKALRVMYSQANDGRNIIAGDYVVAYAIEYAEGYWSYDKNGDFQYSNAQNEKANSHIDLAVLDKKTGRFLFNLNVKATLYDGTGKEIGTHAEPFNWHPWLYHYGENWRVPNNAKAYRLHIHFDPPSYRRYGRRDGRQFTSPVDMDFSNVEIKTGQK